MTKQAWLPALAASFCPVTTSMAQLSLDGFGLRMMDVAVTQKVQDSGNLVPTLDQWIQISQLDWEVNLLAVEASFSQLDRAQSSNETSLKLWAAPGVLSDTKPMRDYDWLPFRDGGSTRLPAFGDIDSWTDFSTSPDTQLGFAAGAEFEIATPQWSNGPVTGWTTVGVDFQFLSLDAFGLDATYSRDGFRDFDLNLSNSVLGISQEQLFNSQYLMTGLEANLGAVMLSADFGLGGTSGFVYDTHHLRDKSTFATGAGLEAKAQSELSIALSDGFEIFANLEVRRAFNLGLIRVDFYHEDGDGREAPPGTVIGNNVFRRPTSVIDQQVDRVSIEFGMAGTF